MSDPTTRRTEQWPTERTILERAQRLEPVEINRTDYLVLDPPFLSPAAARLAMARMRGD